MRSQSSYAQKGDKSKMRSFNHRIPNLFVPAVLIASFCVAPVVFGRDRRRSSLLAIQAAAGLAGAFCRRPTPAKEQPPAYNCEPVNPNATPEARALLKKLCALSGNGILSGQHNFPTTCPSIATGCLKSPASILLFGVRILDFWTARTKTPSSIATG